MAALTTTSIRKCRNSGVEREKLMQEITLHQVADDCYLDEGVRLLELAHSAQRLFAKQEPSEQRRMLNFELDLGATSFSSPSVNHLILLLKRRQLHQVAVIPEAEIRPAVRIGGPDRSTHVAIVKGLMVSNHPMGRN
jgi:hypothetical protein